MHRLMQLTTVVSLIATAWAELGCMADPAEYTDPAEHIGVAQSAIIHGELDGDDHPAVVLVLMEVDGEPAFRCSGTLLNPTTVLTAGHCTGEPGEFSGIRIFTESDVQNGDNNFPFAGPNSVEATAWFSHPEFTNDAFFLHDVGVIKLAEAVDLDPDDYGTLPAVDQLDALQPGRHTTFTTVGYGVQRITPAFVEAELIRMQADPHLVQINNPGTFGGIGLVLSNNASTGGSCFGDSGGPNFLGDSHVVAATTSGGFTPVFICGDPAIVFRIDQADVLAFIDEHLDD